MTGERLPEVDTTSATQTPSVDTVEMSEGATAARARIRRPAGAKFAAFRKFLLDTYGREFLASGSGVLDIAGGQGTLAWDFLNYQSVPITVIDPRRATGRLERHFIYCHRRFERQQSKKAAADDDAAAEVTVPALLRPRHWPVYWRDELWRPLTTESAFVPTPPALTELSAALCSRPSMRNSARRARKGFFDALDDGENDDDEASAASAALPTAEEAWAVMRDCSIAVGCHPDSATESLVDFALATGKPFAVLPCCVCAVDFPRRRLRDNSFETFVEYLVAKAPGIIHRAELAGFEGRNVCLYTLPASSGRDADGVVCGECDDEEEEKRRRRQSTR